MILSNLNITNHHDFLQYGRTPDEMNCSFNRKNGRNLSSRKVISSGNSFHSESNSICHSSRHFNLSSGSGLFL